MATTVPAIAPADETNVDTIRPILTKIVGNGKFQLTIPPKIREMYGLCENDVIEWSFDAKRRELILRPMRAQLITPKLEREIRESVEESVADEDVIPSGRRNLRVTAKASRR